MSTNKFFFFGIVAVFMLSGCSNNWFVHNNGNMPTEERIEKLEKGLSKNEVRSLLGTPSNVISLDEDTWIYMSSKIEQIAFLHPKELERNLIKIKFDENDHISKITRLDLSNGTQIAINKHKTQTYGKKMGFFEKYFGGASYDPVGMNKQH